MKHTVLKIGSKGPAVDDLQALLKKHKFIKGRIDGIFGINTHKAVMSFQESRNEVVDGIVGERTWSALKGIEEQSWRLRETDYVQAAKSLNCEVGAIKAVSEVESAGDGFIEEGLPKILFERHWMYRKLEEYGLRTALDLASKHLYQIVNKTPGGYFGGRDEWNRFDEAFEYNKEAAVESTSWGRFQIMGFHYEHLGYDNPFDFMNDMKKSESEHLKLFVEFIKKDERLLDSIRKKDWRTFAHAYNGPSYAINAYDKKMADAYERLAK